MKFLFLLLLSLNALASELYYLRPDSIDLSIVPIPPLLNSIEDKSDLEDVLKIQSTRTEEDCKRSAFEAEGYATSFFGEPYGPLTTIEASKLIDFQERLFDEVNFYSRILKQRFSRVRPFDRDPRIKPCIPLHRSNSYPSGHAAISYVAARAFAIIYPEKAADFISRGEVVGLDRVVGGVHHPLDVMAGKVLGELVFNALIKEERFLNDLESFK